MITPEAGLQRSLWQRLRHVRIAVAWLCGLVLLLVLIFVAINIRDEPLSVETQAWLREPPNPVTPTDNAFLAVAALQVEQRANSEAGRRMLTAIGKDPRLLLDKKQLAAFGTLWQAPKMDSQLCRPNPGDPSMLARIARKHVELRAMIKQQRPALDRYYAAIALPGFHEITAFPELLPVQSAGEAACLARIDLALRVLDGEKGALESMQSHIGYWAKAFAGSQTLLSARVANLRLHLDMAVLTDLHKLDFVDKQMLFNRLRPSFQAAADVQVGEQIMAGEFRFMAQSIEWSDEGNWLEKSLWALFFKKHATMNQKQYLMALAVRDDKNAGEICEAYRWHNLYNPMGKLISCAAPDLKPYLLQISKMQQDFRHFIATTN